MRRIIAIKGMIAFLVSLALLAIFFSNGKWHLFWYLVLLAAAMIVVFIAYNFKDNSKFYTNVTVLFSGNLLACLLYWYYVGYGQPNQFRLDTAHSLLLCLLAIELCYSGICGIDPGRRKSSVKAEPFTEHVDDINRIQYLLQYTPILGINSAWGNGKSFLIDWLCKDSKFTRKYNVIKIETLAYDYHEFDKIIIAKLEELLQNDGIVSVYSTEIKETIKSTFWGRLVRHFFYGSDIGNASAFVGLKRELGNLSKKVLIVFEDIERVGNPQAVKQLFAIAELLSGDTVKIIFEYDANRLVKSLDVSRDYLEKYIPLEMNLTEISYAHIVSGLWDELHMESADKTITGGVQGDTGLKDLLLTYVNHVSSPFPANGTATGKIEFGKDLLTIRRTKEFLLDIKARFDKFTDSKIDQLTAKTIIAFYFIKNFKHESYDKLEPGTSLEDTFNLSLSGEKFTVSDFYKQFWLENQAYNINQTIDSTSLVNNVTFHKWLTAHLKREENVEAVTIYALFPYPVTDYEKSVEYKIRGQRLSVEDSYDVVAANEKRERVNRIIWNLLQNGKSEYSNAHACVEKFINDVLRKDQAEWPQAWKKYQDDLYHERIYKDNRTIYKIGISDLKNLAQAFSFEEHSEKVWLQFIKFVFWLWKDKSINLLLLEICNSIALDSEDVYLAVLSLFVKLKCGINYNNRQEYWYFLRKYVTPIAYWGYEQNIVHRLLNMLDDLNEGVQRIDIYVDEICVLLKELSAAVQAYLDVQSEQYQADINLIVAFLNKNMQIIRMEKADTDNRKAKSRAILHESVEYPHQNYMSEILSQFEAKPYDLAVDLAIRQELKDAYDKRLLYPVEISEILKKLSLWKNANHDGS